MSSIKKLDWTLRIGVVLLLLFVGTVMCRVFGQVPQSTTVSHSPKPLEYDILRGCSFQEQITKTPAPDTTLIVRTSSGKTYFEPFHYPSGVWWRTEGSVQMLAVGVRDAVSHHLVGLYIIQMNGDDPDWGYQSFLVADSAKISDEAAAAYIQTWESVGFVEINGW